MLTGKHLASTLTTELAEMGLRGIAAVPDERYHAPDSLELDFLSIRPGPHL